MRSDELIHYKPSDRYLHELLFPDLQQDWEKRNQLKLLAEGHNRIASPLYNIALMALAVSAIIGGGFSRMGYSRRIAIFSAVAVAFRILGFVVQAASEEAAWINLFQYLVPLFATYVALRDIFREKVTRFIDMRKKPHRISRRAEAAA
jgi:lipopolysaccharide export system permease protein